MKIEKLGIKREAGYFYYLRSDGVWRSPARRGYESKRKLGSGAEMVKPCVIKRDSKYMYYIDRDGDISFTERKVGGKKGVKR